MMSDFATYASTCLLTEWDARDIALANNDPVATWAKSSASTEGNNLTQGTALQRPLFKTGTYPYLQFDGTNDVLSCNLATDPTVVFVVFEATIDGTTRALYSALSGGNFHWAHLSGSQLTNPYVGTTPSISPQAAWASSLNGVRQAMAFRVTSSTAGCLADRISVSGAITAKPSFAGVLSVGGFNAGTSFPWSGKIHYVATCVGMSLEKIARGLAILRHEWGAPGDDPGSVGGGTSGFTGLSGVGRLGT